MPLTCLFLALSMACAQADGPPAPASGGGSLEKSRLIRYTRSEAGYEATLAVNDRTNMLIFSLTARGANAGGHPPMSRRLEIWKPLLDQLFHERGPQNEYLLTVGEYPELNRRMAAGAVCLEAWDSKTGRPRTGPVGPTLKTLLDRDDAYAELEAFFAPVGYRVTVDHVENVMICRWKGLGGPDDRCQASSDAESLVPCGASMIFKLSRESAAH
jgi:hypothetical protein